MVKRRVPNLLLGLFIVVFGVNLVKAEVFLGKPNPTSFTQSGWFDVARHGQYSVVGSGFKFPEALAVQLFNDNGTLLREYSLDENHFEDLRISGIPEDYTFGRSVAMNSNWVASTLLVRDQARCAVLLANRLGGSFEPRMNKIINLGWGCSLIPPDFGPYVALTESNMFIVIGDVLNIYEYSYSNNNWNFKQLSLLSGEGREIEADGDRFIVKIDQGNAWEVRIYHKHSGDGNFYQQSSVTESDTVVKVDISGDRAVYTLDSRPRDKIVVNKYVAGGWVVSETIDGDFAYGAAIAIENNIIAVGQAQNTNLTDGGVRIFEERWNGWVERNFYRHPGSAEWMGYALELKNGTLLASTLNASYGGATNAGGAWSIPLWEAINY